MFLVVVSLGYTARRRWPMPESVLKGREIVLAGGSGGLGAASSELLAAEGARLVVSYRSNRQRADRLKPIAAVIQADLTRAEDRVRLLDAAPEMFGLVVFAGDPVRFTDPAQIEQRMLDSHRVNYAGPLLLAREAAARMRARGTAGSIVSSRRCRRWRCFPARRPMPGRRRRWRTRRAYSPRSAAARPTFASTWSLRE